METRPPADFQRWELAPAPLTLVAAATLAGYAALMGGTRDIGLAYLGGLEAWRSGHPELVFTWISTPFLGMLMALATRVAGEVQLATIYNFLDILLAAALIAAVWARLRGRVDRRLWWITLLAAILFAPLSSSLWWKQLNLPALALAAAGWDLLQRPGSRRDLTGSALVALSISLKPVLILLPLALLLRRDGRRPGLLAIGYVALLQGAAQVFLAWRAGDLAALSPLPALGNFSAKSLPAADGWACDIQNFSPTATLCRVVGSPQQWPLQRLAVLGLVLLLGFLLLRSLSGRRGRSWEMFGACALLTPMLSPLAWSHYQLLLAPLLLLLAVQLPREREAVPMWILLAAAYLLAEISWTPIGTVADLGAQFGLLPRTDLRTYGMLLTGASFAQYFLLAAAVRWFWRGQPNSAVARPIPFDREFSR